MESLNLKYTGNIKPGRRQMTKDQEAAELKAIYEQIETMKADQANLLYPKLPTYVERPFLRISR